MENQMTWRWLGRLGLGLPLFAALAIAAIPSLRYKALGRLRGEPFYRGLPHRYWIDALRTGDAQTRKDFFHGVRKNDTKVVPILEALLEIESADLRREATEGLGRVGPPAAPAVRQLCWLAAQDGDERVRTESQRTLDRLGDAALAELMEALGDTRDAVRGIAAAELAQLGPAARPATPVLLRLLKDQDRSVQRQAREALDHIGLDRDTATPVLRQLLDDETRELRFWAAEMLAGFDSASADQAIPILLQGVESDNPVHDRAVRALTRLGSLAVPALLRAAQHPKAELRSGAVEALGAVRAPEVPPALFAALMDPDNLVRQQAAYGLERSGPDIIPADRAALRDPEDSVRITTLELLAKLGRAAQSERGEVLAALKDSSDGVRKAAVAALVQISPDDLPALVDAAVQTLRKGSSADRLEALRRLELFGTRAAVALPALMSALEDPDPHVRAAAADAVGEVGAAAPEAVTALARGLKDKDVLVRRRVASAVRKSINVLNSGPAVRPVLVGLGDALRDVDGDVRRIAAEALQEVVYQASDSATLGLVIPVLVEALPDKVDKVRGPVEDALAKACERVTAENKVLIPSLVQILQQKTGIRDEASAALAKAVAGVGPADQTLVMDWLVLLKEDATPLAAQTQILHAVAKVGPGAKAAVPALIEMLRRYPVRERRPAPGPPGQAQVILRLAALHALAAIGPEATPAVPILIEALEADEPMRIAGNASGSAAPAKDVPYGVRQTAAFALGRIGTAAAAAIPALTRASQGENKDVRAAAEAALKQIRGKPAIEPAKPKERG
jgi:HEAT repeat protein